MDLCERSTIILLPLPCLWSQRCSCFQLELKIPWLTSFQHYRIICTHSSQELCVNGISCHNLLFNLVLLRLSGMRCHLPNVDPGTPLHCCAVNGSRIPSRRSQEFTPILTICILHRHCFYAGEPEHTADRAHPTQVLEPSTYWSLHSSLKKKKSTCYNTQYLQS